MPSYNAEWYRRTYGDVSRGLQLLASETPTTVFADFITPKNANYTIYIQRVTFNVSTSHANQLTVQDDASTPVVFAKSIASPALGLNILFEGGAEGVPITAGKNLEITGTAGAAGSVMIEAYQKLSTVIAHTNANQ